MKILKRADDFFVMQGRIFMMVCVSAGGLLIGMPGAHSKESVGECMAVATVFDQTICRESLEKTARGALETEAVSERPDEMLETAGRTEEEVGVPLLQDALRREIWQAALREKFGAAVFDIEPEIMEAYRDKAQSLKERGYEINKEVRALLAAALADENKYSSDERRVMQGILEATKASILVYEKKREHVETAPESMGFIDEETTYELARRAIRRWQIDKALFKEYGGKLVRAGNMIVPVDAYRHFGLFILKEGQPEIRDEALLPVKAAFANSPGIPETQALDGDDPSVVAYFEDPLHQLKADSNLPDIDLLKSWLEERAQDE